MRTVEGAGLLALWERGCGRHALDRSALLAAWARPELAPEDIPDLPLGQVTAALLALRAACFGPRIAAHVDCAACGQRLELALSTHELLQPEPGDDTIAMLGTHCRPPTLRDLAAVAGERDSAIAARRLLARCRVSEAADESLIADETLRAFEDALENVDPNADLAFDVRCDTCGERCTAQLDAGELLWDELDAHARALLDDVHRLARSYGWSEHDILALSPARRAAYLARVAP
jgi:hypothetical protein